MIFASKGLNSFQPFGLGVVWRELAERSRSLTYEEILFGRPKANGVMQTFARAMGDSVVGARVSLPTNRRKESS